MTSGLSSGWKKLTGRGRAKTPKTNPESDPISVFSKAGPPDANLFTKLAELQEAAGNVTGAAEQYEKALREDAKFLPALLGYARLEDRNGHRERAVELYEAAIAAHPDDPAAYNDLAMCHARLGKLPDAVAPLERAIQLTPHRKLYRNNLAMVLVDLGRVDDARRQLVTAHGEAVGSYNLGYLLAERGRLQEADAAFAQALELMPEMTSAQQWREALAARMAEGDSAEDAAVAADEPVEVAPVAVARRGNRGSAGAAAPAASPDSDQEAPTPEQIFTYRREMRAPRPALAPLAQPPIARRPTESTAN